MSLGELWKLKKFLWKEQLFLLTLYPKNGKFILANICLGLFSFFCNPYRMARKRGVVYGETPICALEQIAKKCRLTSADVWWEWGSGRGKGLFWIATRYRCKVMGIEKLRLFSAFSNAVLRLLRLPGSVTRGDFLQNPPFSGGTVVYIDTTLLEEREMEAIAAYFQEVTSPIQIVTVGAPLPGFSAKSFLLTFSWGDTEGFLNNTIAK